MRFIAQVIVTVVAGFFLELFLPWWSVALAAFVGALLVDSRRNFAGGFLAIGVLWLAKALITDLGSHSDLADRVASIFMLHNKVLLLLVTFVLSGLVGGFAAMSAGALRGR